MIDSHAHYDNEQFDPDRDDVINRAVAAGVTHIVNAGCDIESSKFSIALSKGHKEVYAAVGVHPHEALTCGSDTLETLRSLSREPKVVAIGEIGLDYHYDFSPRDVQKEWFEKQLGLAVELKLPVIIHDRESHQDILEIVKSFSGHGLRGVFHCFSGSVEMAREVLELGFHIGIGGPVTFKKAKKPLEVVSYVPLESILIETDCPYLAPEPHRGGRNWSGYLTEVIGKIAEIKGINYDEAEQATSGNAISLFSL